MRATARKRENMTGSKAVRGLLASVFSMAFVLMAMVFAGGSVADEIGVHQVHVSPHDFKPERCSVCHTAEPPALLRDPVTTCVKCHPGNIGNHPVTKHPMGQMTKIKIPSYLPLTEENEMVCHTCHNPHKKTKYPRMLRVDYFRLCQACHVGY